LKKSSVLSLAFFLLLMCSLSHAQFVTDRAVGTVPGGVNGQTETLIPISYGQVRVCTSLDIGTSTSPCPDVASITDIYGNPLTIVSGNFGQITTDVVGRFSFGCTSGNSYEIQVVASSSNVPTLNYPISCPGGAGSGGGGVGGANISLSNLSGVAINTSLLPATSGSANIGSQSLPFGYGWFLNRVDIAGTGVLTFGAPPLGTLSVDSTVPFGIDAGSAGGAGNYGGAFVASKFCLTPSNCITAWPTGGGVGTGTQYALTYWATSGTLGSIIGNVSGQICVAANGGPCAFASVGVPGQTLTSATYTVQCDSSTTIIDRATLIVDNYAGAGTITMPDAGTAGCGSYFVVALAAGVGAGTITVHNTSTSTFTVLNGSTATSGATSFALTAGQYATINSPDNLNWVARVVSGGGGGGGGADKALDNLVAVNINTSLLAQAGVNLGSTSAPFQNLFLYGSGSYGTKSIELTGTPTGTDILTLPDETGVILANNGANTGTASMTLNMSASTVAYALQVPSQANLLSNGTSSIAYDTVSKVLHVPSNNADAFVMSMTAQINTGQIPKAVGGTYGNFTGSAFDDTSIVVTTTESIITANAADDLGTATSAFRNLYLYGTQTYGSGSFELTGLPSANDVLNLPDMTTGYLVGESAAIANNTIPKASSGTVASLAGSALSDNGTTVISSEGLQFSGASGAATTISTSTANAPIFLTPNGTGYVNVPAGSNTNAGFTFGAATTEGLYRQGANGWGYTNGSNPWIYFTSATGMLLDNNGAYCISNTATNANNTPIVCLVSPGTSATEQLILSKVSGGDGTAPPAFGLLRAEGVTAGNSNVAGSDFDLAGGPSTGTGGCSRVNLESTTFNATSGTTQNALKTSAQFGNCKSLSTTSGTAQTVMTPTLTTLQSDGGTLKYTVHVDNGTDTCTVHGFINWVLTNKASTYSGAVSSSTETPLITGSACGAISTTWAWSTNNLQVTPTFTTISATHAYMYWSSTDEGDGSLP
jgi:hypothetical protein